MHSLSRLLILASVIVSILLPAFAPAQQRSTLKKDSAAIEKTINYFVDAFSNLKWEKFSRFFADDVTAFFPPSAHRPARANNKEEVLSVFKTVFENAQKQSNPHITINPVDTKFQLAGEIAIVTFHLHDPGMYGRRTIILKKEKEKWLIIHLHASAMQEEK